MEFWGVEVLPNKPVTCPFEPIIYTHVSNVALGETKGARGERIVVRANCGDQDIVLGTLVPESVDQIALDLIFGQDFTLSHNSKSCSVYFSGYKTEGPGDVFDDEDSEDDSEDVDNPVLPKPQAAKPVAAKVEKPKAAPKVDGKKEKETPKKDAANAKKDAPRKDTPMKSPGEDDDESDDDESDSEGFDTLGDSDDDVDDEEDSEEDEEDDEDGEDEDESDSDEDQPQGVKEAIKELNDKKKKRAMESPATVTPPAQKKVKTPMGGKPVKTEKSAGKTKQPQTPVTVENKDVKKGDKKDKKSPNGKAAATPGSDAKSASEGKYRCEPCKRGFHNETGLAQHNTAKHKK